MRFDLNFDLKSYSWNHGKLIGKKKEEVEEEKTMC